MKYSTLVFSPTGGTQKVLDILTEDWGPSQMDIDLSDRLFDFSSVSFNDQDTAVIAVPVFEGRVPAPAAERLSLVKGNGAAAVLVAVFGNRAIDDALIELADLAEKAGFKVMAGVEASAEHSIMRKYGAGRPDSDDIAELKDYAEKIKTKLEQGGQDAVMPGNRPYVTPAGISFLPHTSNKCVSCGVCVRKCPVGAISPADPKKVDKDKCMLCMRCMSVCPKGAKSVNKLALTAASLAMKKHLSSRKKNVLHI